MTDETPFDAPVPPPPTPPDSGNGTLKARVVLPGHGLGWLVKAWAMFAAQPLLWMVAFVSVVGIFFFMGMIPLVSFAAPIIVPILNGGVALMARKQDRNENASYEDIFAGFNEKAGPLAGIGLVNLGAGFVIVLVAVVIIAMGGGAALVSQGLNSDSMDFPYLMTAMMPTMLFMILVVTTLYFVVLSAVWFAPALVMLNGLSVVEALTVSFKAVLSNFLPFLVYGVISMIIGFLASIPMFLGWILFMPVIMASNYVAYKDIFDQ